VQRRESLRVRRVWDTLLRLRRRCVCICVEVGDLRGSKDGDVWLDGLVNTKYRTSDLPDPGCGVRVLLELYQQIRGD
jgi:hypothetical protein